MAWRKKNFRCPLNKPMSIIVDPIIFGCKTDSASYLSLTSHVTDISWIKCILIHYLGSGDCIKYIIRWCSQAYCTMGT